MGLMMGLTAAFAVAGGVAGFGAAVWHEMGRLCCRLNGMNPDKLYGRERNPYIHGLGGVFIGAALGAGLAAGIDHIRDSAPPPVPAASVTALSR